MYTVPTRSTPPPCITPLIVYRLAGYFCVENV
nr:MAG TPA: hypothetical protein [Caudoviricetes sp.]